jgi:hypothetical protein
VAARDHLALAQDPPEEVPFDALVTVLKAASACPRPPSS